MTEWGQVAVTEGAVTLAEACRPRDVWTNVARFVLKGLNAALMILLPLEMVTTSIGGCLIAVTFGLFALLLTVVWLPLLGSLLLSSWLWLRAWYVRPVLLIPGMVLSFVATLYVMLAPEPERGAKWAKLAIAQEWPLSWLIMRPPVGYYSTHKHDTLTAEGD